MQATSTTRQVQVALGASQQTDVAVGDKVTITLPNNQTTPGVVSSVGTVATCPSSSGSGGSGSSSSCAGNGHLLFGQLGEQRTRPSPWAVTPSDPAATGTWDQAPVQVGITTARVPDALVVPVTALLAQPGGGYAVEVVGAGESNHLVPVSLGLFDDADGLVQVTGSGLAAGPESGGPVDMTFHPATHVRRQRGRRRQRLRDRRRRVPVLDVDRMSPRATPASRPSRPCAA